MAKYTVNVTQEDIDAGISDSSMAGEFCPVERAVSRAIHEPVICGPWSFSTVSDRSVGHDLPFLAKEWIREYGFRPKVYEGTPFSFEVDIND